MKKTIVAVRNRSYYYAVGRKYNGDVIKWIGRKDKDGTPVYRVSVSGGYVIDIPYHAVLEIHERIEK